MLWLNKPSKPHYTVKARVRLTSTSCALTSGIMLLCHILRDNSWTVKLSHSACFQVERLMDLIMDREHHDTGIGNSRDIPRQHDPSLLNLRPAPQVSRLSSWKNTWMPACGIRFSTDRKVHGNCDDDISLLLYSG